MEENPANGDPEGDIDPDTLFEKLSEEWICPDCGESKDMFIEV
ncbi:rubredoxin [Anaerostipes hominis (ex Lee et al. 2021)]